jgi:DNA-binding NarL/FixJ family response regulator
MNTRILIADDHAMLCEGLKSLLSQQPDFEVVGMAPDGREAVRECARLNPDVVIMDITMRGLNGIEATARIRRAHPQTSVIILSMHDTAEHVYRALEAGANGYLVKDSAPRELVEAVRTVRLGRRYLGHKLQAQWDTSDPVRGPVDRLSAREREVLQLVMEGKSSAEIARVLELSPKTVETSRSRLMVKLGVHDVASLARIAIKLGLA